MKLRRHNGVKNARNKKLRLVAIYGQKCMRCKRAFTLDELTCDHVIPRAKGGNDHIENLQLLCEPCNQYKKTSIIDYRTGARPELPPFDIARRAQS